jgi:predicted transcriptional regulator
MADLLDKTGKPAGTVAGRLSELVSELYVERVGRGKYRITAYGVKEFMEEVLPKLEGAR